LEAIKWIGLAAIVAITFIGLLYVSVPEEPAGSTNVCTTVTETITVTRIVTVTSITTPSAGYASIIDSSGRCGTLEKPILKIVEKKPVNEENGYVVTILYSEQTSVPCYRHVIENSYLLKRYPPIVEISLKLESTSDVCIECVGVVETLIKIGSRDNPIPEGTEIKVNGLVVVV